MWMMIRHNRMDSIKLITVAFGAVFHHPKLSITEFDIRCLDCLWNFLITVFIYETKVSSGSVTHTGNM
jgi:hypothetical protein